jgi:hypothetical protein
MQFSTLPMLTPKRAETLLRWLLIANGVIVLLALPAVFMPTAWMDNFHQRLMHSPLVRVQFRVIRAIRGLILLPLWIVSRGADRLS